MSDDTPRAEPRRARDAEGRFEYIGHAPTPARLRVVRHPAAARAWRAARVLALCWGLALAAVFLPLLHFVLVPGLVGLGIVLAFSRLGERRTVLSAAGACPACGGALRVEPCEAARETLALRCPHCRRAIALRPDAG